MILVHDGLDVMAPVILRDPEAVDHVRNHLGRHAVRRVLEPTELTMDPERNRLLALTISGEVSLLGIQLDRAIVREQDEQPIPVTTRHVPELHDHALHDLDAGSLGDLGPHHDAIAKTDLVEGHSWYPAVTNTDFTSAAWSGLSVILPAT